MSLETNINRVNGLLELERCNVGGVGNLERKLIKKGILRISVL